MVFDVKSEFSTEIPGEDRQPAEGPAQVASEAYRRGWDTVWGNRRGDRSIN